MGKKHRQDRNNVDNKQHAPPTSIYITTRTTAENTTALNFFFTHKALSLETSKLTTYIRAPHTSLPRTKNVKRKNRTVSALCILCEALSFTAGQSWLLLAYRPP
uniref:Uncharacterized protein n=1 Tax=Lotharella globosa TaxID=91324 RepID=A0A7S3Z532_9EUKA